MTRISIDVENLMKIQKLNDSEFLELFHNLCNYLLMYERKDSAGYQAIHYQISSNIKPIFDNMISDIKISYNSSKDIDITKPIIQKYLSIYNNYEYETLKFIERIDKLKED